MNELSKEQMAALDDMVARRMEATGESRKEACFGVANYLSRVLSLMTKDDPSVVT
tara:strand:+ start:1131 stop:1295 length:165 start_codon:yes stop_codon:yes gene_type:complete